MQLDRYFEDLEAQFAYARSDPGVEAPLGDSNFVRVLRRGGVPAELAMPILGSNFVAGMALGANVFRVFPFTEIRQLTFETLKAGQLENLRELQFDLGEFLNRLRLPFEIHWTTREDIVRQHGVVVDVLDNLLRIQIQGIDHSVAVPLIALSELQIDSVENSNDKI